MVQIRVSGVSRFFARHRTMGPNEPRGKAALDGASLEVGRGEFLAIVGPSGCGKTTLLRCIAGFETPDVGSIEVAGKTVARDGRCLVPAAHRGVGYVPQDGAVFPHLSVQKNVEYGLRHLSRTARAQRAAEALELVGLADFAHRRPHQLSGGQQQRVALARALAPRPNVILLDEPFSALDAYLRDSLRRDVRRILMEVGATAVFVTHDQEEALSLGDRVAAMRDGRMIQTAPSRDVYSRPSDVELAHFFGEAMVTEGFLHRRTGESPSVSCDFGELAVDPGSLSEALRSGPCRVMIRPEQIQITAHPSDSAVYGTVNEVTYYGHDSLLRIDVPQLGASVNARILADHGLRSGDSVYLNVGLPVCVYPALVAQQSAVA